jgi:diguanylate cyclase (GGDEF)-like protein/PAS domain S-box-containing protein
MALPGNRGHTMKNKYEIPLNSPQFDETFAKAAKLLEGKSNVLDNILASMGDGMSIQDRNMRIVHQNKFMIDNFGSHIGEHCYKIYERRESLCEGCPIVEAYRTGKVAKALRVGITKDGERFRFENIASVLRNHQGEIVAGIELVRIVEDRERALDELRAAMEQLEQAKAVYESSSEGIMVMDRNNRIISVNPAFVHITGYSYDEVVGRDPKILRSGLHTAEFYAEIWRSLQETGTWRGEIWNKRKNGQVYPQSMRIDTILGDDSEVSKRVCIFSDITEKKLAEEQIKHTALHDALTDLPNRILYEDRLHQALAMARREKTSLALLYIDLDHFKPVNDTLGHTTGDTLLKLVAQRMLDCVRKTDTVARVGGDEFAVVLPAVHSRQNAMIVAEKIRKKLETPFEINGKQLDISSSIGCAMYPDDGQDETTLTQGADQAMYMAKQNGRNRVCFKDTPGFAQFP